MIKKIILFLLISAALVSTIRADIYTASRACVRVWAKEGVGSGIVVGSDGSYYYALTNAHVATDKTARVEFFDAGKVTTASAEVVARDAQIDLAVLKIDTKGYNPAIIPIDPSYTLKEGDPLCTIGHPQGKHPTAFFCTYQKSDPAFGIMFLPPPIEGRSGSPLLAPDGSRVVGIVYGYTVENGGAGYGLAISGEVVRNFVNGAVDSKKNKSVWKLPEKGIVTFLQKRSILEDKPSVLAQAEPGEEPGEEPAAELEPAPPAEPMEAVEVEEARRPLIPEQLIPEQPPVILPGLPTVPRLLPERPTDGPRLFGPLRNRKAEQQERTPDPALTGVEVQVEGDNWGVKIGGDGAEKKPAAPPVNPQVIPAPPPRWVPPRSPAPMMYPPPPPPGKTPHPVVPAPTPLKTGSRTGSGIDEREGEAETEIHWVQYAPFYSVPQGSCPGGNCPTQPQIVTPQRPADIKSEGPIPAQIIGGETKPETKPETAPQAGPPPTKPQPGPPAVKPEPAPQIQVPTAPPPEKRPGVVEELLQTVRDARNQAGLLAGEIGGLKERQAAAEKRLEALENIYVPAFFGRKTVPEAVENGLGAAGENLAKVLTVEVGESVRGTLAQAVDTMKAGTEAAAKAQESFTETMTKTQETLEEIKRCTVNVARLLWILSAGLGMMGGLILWTLWKKRLKIT